jgi:hypothetical protein
MTTCTNHRSVSIVTACMNSNGSPGFAITEVEVTQEEADNGVHYSLAEAQLLERGYEEPFVHFAQGESPDFLHPAVREHLDLMPTHVADNPRKE